MEEEETLGQEDDVVDGEELVDGMAPTPKRIKLAKSDGLKKALSTGKYPHFEGVAGVAEKLDPSLHSCIDYVKLLWPDSLCEHIATQTNLYARQQGADNWKETSLHEIWIFLAIIINMGIHRLPSYPCYWSTDPLLGVDAIKNSMSFNRFRSLRRYLHCDDNEGIVDSTDLTSKIRTIVSTLSKNFILNYNPGQEISIDEMMVKYKGRKGGKIRMPKKPIRLGFKIWCCSCSCCGYLCCFSVYNGRPVDALGQKFTEKGLVAKVVHKLLVDEFDFTGINHVVYMDNYFMSGPIIKSLEQHKIYTVGTINQNAAGFPAELKGIKPPKGSFVAKTVDGIAYTVFHDRKIVCFATNAFPETMKDACFRMQLGGILRSQSVPPCLFPYNQLMGAVDTTNQRIKSYGYDRKCWRYWFRLFFQMFDLAVNNAYILYKHNCKIFGIEPMTLLSFRLGVARNYLCVSGRKCSSSSGGVSGVCSPLAGTTLVSVDRVGLKRGRCHVCVRERRPSAEQRHTTRACSRCSNRLCKTHSLDHTCTSD